MKSASRFFAALGLLASVLSAHATIERVVQKTFAVQPGGVLRIKTESGGIHVEPTGGTDVVVEAHEHIRASSDADADDLLKKLTLSISLEGNDVMAVSEYEKPVFSFHFGSWPPVVVEFVVRVPARYSAELQTSGGSIAVGNLDGSVHARTSGGNIEIQKITGTVDARTSGGNVALKEGLSAVSLSTMGGNIQVGHAVGAADLHTSGGSIRIESADNVVTARTMGGNVSATINGQLKGNCTLTTAGGRVQAVVSPKASFHLDASTLGGYVSADGIAITLEGSKRRSHMSGDVGGGGPVLEMHSFGGNVVVSAAKS